MATTLDEVHNRIVSSLGLDTSQCLEQARSSSPSSKLLSRIRYLYYQNRPLLNDLLSRLEQTTSGQRLTRRYQDDFLTQIEDAVKRTKPSSAQTSTELHVSLTNATPMRKDTSLHFDDAESPFFSRRQPAADRRPLRTTVDSSLPTSAQTSFASTVETSFTSADNSRSPPTAATSFASETTEDDDNGSTVKLKDSFSTTAVDTALASSSRSHPRATLPSSSASFSSSRGVNRMSTSGNHKRPLPWTPTSRIPDYSRQQAPSTPTKLARRSAGRQTLLNFTTISGGPSDRDRPKKRASGPDAVLGAEDTPTKERSSVETMSAKRPRMTAVSHQISAFPADGFGEFDPQLSDVKDRKSINEVAKARLRNLPKDTDVDLFVKDSLGRNLMLCASMSFIDRARAKLFRTELAITPVEKSNRVEREFGWHRLMCVKMDMDRKKLPSVLAGQWDGFVEHLNHWLLQPHRILGRTWRAFHVQDETTILTGSQQSTSDKLLRVIMFATEGLGIQTVSFTSFLDRLLHFDRNSQQNGLKLFSRLDLPISRTISSYTVAYDAFTITADPTPTSGTECDRFMDVEICGSHVQARVYDSSESMTDGNNVMSVGMAKQICTMLDLKWLPTAFQARFLGSKGVWYISAPYYTDDPEHLRPWIKVNTSQVKIKLDYESLTVAERTFDIVRANSTPRPADLHRDFLPVLVDRGVSEVDLCQLAATSIEEQKETFLLACEDPKELALLIHSKASRRTVISQDGQRPAQLQSDTERARLMLHEGGFMPKDNEYMATLVLRLCVQHLSEDLRRFRFKCPKSTSLLGIAVASNALQSDEVFISFSEAFEDKRSSEKIGSLAGREVIIARDPTLRPSDIQKFMCVDKPELAHLRDVVVFSSKGRMPAAAKLQGGDYDGDIFWVSWEPALTKNFRNAPVLQPRPCEELFIQRETRTFAQLCNGSVSDAAVDTWLSHCMQFKLRDGLLGMVTNYANDLTYHRGGRDTAVKECVDIHDYIIDSAKNGYIFSQADFQRWKAEHGLQSMLSKPTWKKSLEELKDILSGQDEHLPRSLAKRLLAFFSKTGREVPARRYKSIHDRLWFEVMLPGTNDAITELEDVLAKAKDPDECLFEPVQKLSTYPGATDDAIKALIRATENEIKPLLDELQRLCSFRKSSLDEHYSLRTRFHSIRPTADFAPLAFRDTDCLPTAWDRVRASILARMQRKRTNATPFRVFWLAFEALCQVKAGGEIGSRRVGEVRAILQPKRSKHDNALWAGDRQRTVLPRPAPRRSTQSLESAFDRDFWDDDAEDSDEYGDVDFSGIE